MESLKLFSSLFNNKLTDEAQKDMLTHISKTVIKKGTILANQNKKPSLFYILLSGVIRCYITDNNGKENIKDLFVPLTPTGPLSSLINKSTSEAIYDCLTDCVVLECNFIKIRELTNKHHCLSLIYNEALEKSFIRTEERIYDLSVLNSTQRYLKLKKDIPNIDNLIQQYHIASYLNITAVQLSRIRKELFSK